MVFSSTMFLFLFMPVVLLGHSIIRKELRNVFLLLMSLGFYAYGEPKFVFVMIASCIVNYVSAYLIAKFERVLILKRLFLVCSLLCNLGILFYYKYFNFVISNINGLFGTDFVLRNIVLPIGISFFTFQGMSYVIDVYTGKVEVQKNPLNVMLYVSLFPQLIAGPIVRYSDINSQIEERTVSADGFVLGLKRFTYGLAKKVIISNHMALIADLAFNSEVSKLSAAMAWLGAICYTLQIYFDFSGYSDMAIGLGKMLGFDFLENFNYPYISKSITEFWRRWHISLSSWFRDYVYIPLGGNRRGNVYVNLWVVFILTGIWHGASWNFIFWGIWHGFFIMAERILKKKEVNIKLPKILKWLYTVLIVIIGWVFFRAADLTTAVCYLKSMIMLNGNSLTDSAAGYYFANIAVLLIIGTVLCAPIYKKLGEISDKFVLPNRLRAVFSPVFIICLFLLAAAFTVASTYNPFIYFNF